MYPDICICICICICVRIRLEFPSFYADAVHTSLGINLYLFREHNNPKVKNQKQQRATGIHESKKKKNSITPCLLKWTLTLARYKDAQEVVAAVSNRIAQYLYLFTCEYL